MTDSKSVNTRAYDVKMKAKRLWADGLSVSNIAKQCGVNKGVISGMAHRDRVNFPHRNQIGGSKYDSYSIPDADALWMASILLHMAENYFEALDEYPSKRSISNAKKCRDYADKFRRHLVPTEGR